MMGRTRLYDDDATKQRAYRARADTPRNIVTQTPGQNGRRYDISPVLGAVQAASSPRGAVWQHSVAVGLLVRVEAELGPGRVLATVLQAGQSRLQAGVAYPFRRDLLSEVQP